MEFKTDLAGDGSLISLSTSPDARLKHLFDSFYTKFDVAYQEMLAESGINPMDVDNGRSQLDTLFNTLIICVDEKYPVAPNDVRLVIDEVLRRIAK